MTERQNDTKSMALFCDFENVALGVRESKYQQFDISKVLERLLLKGSIVVKKAYCDWERYREFKAAMHQASFELIEIPHLRMSGKNSADIRLVVDALDLCYTKSHVDTFVIISGDSDFSPLVSKLRENAKTVIGVGVKNSTSELLINNCDEFIYYDDLVRLAKPARRRAGEARGRGLVAAAPTPAVAEAEVVAPAHDAASALPAAPGKRRRSVKSKAVALEGMPVDVMPSDVMPAAESAAEPAEAPLLSESLQFEPVVAPAPVPAKARRAGARSRSTAAAPVPIVVAAVEETPEEPRDQQSDDRMQQALDLVVSTIEALAAERGEDEKIWGSMVKQTLKRRKPGFNESYYGFRSFNRLLEEARDRGLIELDLDDKSGGYTVSSLA